MANTPTMPTIQLLKDTLTAVLRELREDALLSRMTLTGYTNVFCTNILPTTLSSLFLHQLRDPQKMNGLQNVSRICAATVESSSFRARSYYDKARELVLAAPDAMKQECRNKWEQQLGHAPSSSFMEALREELTQPWSGLTEPENRILERYAEEQFLDWLSILTLLAATQPCTPTGLPMNDPTTRRLKNALLDGLADSASPHQQRAQEASALFANNQWRDALELWQELETVEALRTRAAYQEALCFIQLSNRPAAVEKLEQAAKGKDPHYAALALMKLAALTEDTMPAPTRADQQEREAVREKCFAYLTRAEQLGSTNALRSLAELHLKGFGRAEEQPLQLDLDAAKGCCERLVDAANHGKGDNDLMWAAWTLWKGASEGKWPLRDPDRERYLRLAAEEGSQEAISQLEQARLPIFAPLSRRDQGGIAVFTTADPRVLTVASSVPANWKLICLEEPAAGSLRSRLQREGVTFDPNALLTDHLVSGHSSRLPHRFFLLSEDQDRNLQDAIELVQCLVELEADMSRWEVQLYLRGDREQLAPSVDSLVTRMGKDYIPIHIIDEELDAAEDLLTRLPLFAPILPDAQTTSKLQDPLLNVVILGADRCAEELVRTAYWMLSHEADPDHLVNPFHSSITVLGTGVTALKERLRCRCPGIFSSDHKSTMWLNNPDPQFHEAPWGSEVFREHLKELLRSGRCYFIVTGGTDLENQSHAIWLREMAIRTRPDAPRSAVVAFRCRSAETASLSQHLVVHGEKYGTGWFNTYHIHAFGDYRSRYQWDQLSGGVLDEMGQSVHLFYMGVKTGSQLTRQAARDKLQDYYARTYNRESSRCLAMFLITSAFLSSSLWDMIRKRGLGTRWESWAWLWSEDGLKLCAKAVENYLALNTDVRVQFLAHLEHNRWCAWLLSRGWMPAGEEELHSFTNAGNPRQQLYVGRIHALLAPFEQLDIISSLCNRYVTPLSHKTYDFKTQNYDTVRDMPNVLRRALFQLVDTVMDTI